MLYASLYQLIEPVVLFLCAQAFLFQCRHSPDQVSYDRRAFFSGKLSLLFRSGLLLQGLLEELVVVLELPLRVFEILAGKLERQSYKRLFLKSQEC